MIRMTFICESRYYLLWWSPFFYIFPRKLQQSTLTRGVFIFYTIKTLYSGRVFATLWQNSKSHKIFSKIATNKIFSNMKALAWGNPAHKKKIDVIYSNSSYTPTNIAIYLVAGECHASKHESSSSQSPAKHNATLHVLQYWFVRLLHTLQGALTLGRTSFLPTWTVTSRHSAGGCTPTNRTSTASSADRVNFEGHFLALCPSFLQMPHRVIALAAFVGLILSSSEASISSSSAAR